MDGPIGWRLGAALTAVTGTFFAAELITTLVWRHRLTTRPS